ncbi:MAG TPA: exodeoxyribonuclease VII small subunit [Candidatus Baltobacteraceae bacterium]
MAENASGHFEQALDELEKIVARLEREDLALEESVDLFKKGRELATRCERLLTSAQQAIDAAMKTPEPTKEKPPALSDAGDETLPF